MYPFIPIGKFLIPTYGLFMPGFAVAVLLYMRLSPRFEIQREDAFYMSLFAAVGGVGGAKVLAILVALPGFLKELFEGGKPDFMNLLLGGGFVFWGGFLGGFGLMLFYIRRFQIDPGRAFNMAAARLAFGHGIGRIGCLMVGCCYGKPCEHGIVFHHSPVAPNNIPLVPTQLIEIGFNFLLGAVLLFLATRSRWKNRLAFVYLFSYPVFRFVLEFYRGDEYRGIFLGLSTSQWISLLVLLGSGVILLRRCRKNRKKRQGETLDKDPADG